jgi:hypothetical protein
LGSIAQTNNMHAQNQQLRAARDLLLPRLMRGEIAVQGLSCTFL